MPPITMTPVQSSQIHSIGFDSETNTMHVRFLAGRGEQRGPGALYQYTGVSAEDFAAFDKAESKGSYFGKVFKPAADRFPFTRVDESKKDE
ncbi:MAG: KTSC domain-containing protein [Pseudoxanthomonas sp.]|nr:KTSC domain-containing protein [Pseudoxanthomonas sp.]